MASSLATIALITGGITRLRTTPFPFGLKTGLPVVLFSRVRVLLRVSHRTAKGDGGGGDALCYSATTSTAPTRPPTTLQPGHSLVVGGCAAAGTAVASALADMALVGVFAVTTAMALATEGFGAVPARIGSAIAVDTVTCATAVAAATAGAQAHAGRTGALLYESIA